MKTKTSIALALWITMGAAIGFPARHATSQRRPTDVEVLARIAVHETGWEDTGDLEAIYAVLHNGAEREGISFQAFARSYSSRLMAGTVTRSWAAQLTEACTRPPSWPRVTTRCHGRGEDRMCAVEPHAAWSGYVDRCRAVVARARETIAGERTHHCEREPHDWGGRVDRERARRLGLIEVECSAGDVETIGDYYARPSLVRAEGALGPTL